MPQLYSPVMKTKPSAPRIWPASFSSAAGVWPRIFLVHAVEHRQPDRLGVDQLDIVSARAKALDDELRQADAHAVGSIRTVKHEKVAHAAD